MVFNGTGLKTGHFTVGLHRMSCFLLPIGRINVAINMIDTLILDTVTLTIDAILEGHRQLGRTVHNRHIISPQVLSKAVFC